MYFAELKNMNVLIELFQFLSDIRMKKMFQEKQKAVGKIQM